MSNYKIKIIGWNIVILYIYKIVSFTVALCLVDAIQNDLTLLRKNIYFRKLKFQNNKLLLETTYLWIIGGSLNILAAERFLVISLLLLKFYEIYFYEKQLKNCTILVHNEKRNWTDRYHFAISCLEMRFHEITRNTQFIN